MALLFDAFFGVFWSRSMVEDCYVELSQLFQRNDSHIFHLLATMIE